MRNENGIYILFVFCFIFIISYSIYAKIYAYILDSLVSIAIISILILFYKSLNLNKLIFIFSFLALLSHNLGVFGFYANSPFTFEYDHLTHFLGGFALCLVFLNFLNCFFSKEKKTNLFLGLTAFLAALGFGSIIEITEYVGYLILGKGEGMFYFGGTGDLSGLVENAAWINSSLDMVFNLIGALFALFACFIFRKTKKPE